MDRNLSIKEMLKDQDPSVRRDACEIICGERSVEYVPGLIEVLKDEHPGAREAALNALISIGGVPVAEAVAPLLRLEDVALRNIGIEILQQIGPDSLGVIGGLLKDSDDDVVKFGVDILASMKQEKAIELLSSLSGHRNPNVRASVALCLGRVMDSSALPLLVNALYDKEEWVRFSAIEGLGYLHDSGSLLPLLGIIEKDSGLIKEAAIEAVSKIATPQDSALILSKLESFIKNGMVINVEAVVELIEKATAPGSSFQPSRGSKEVFFGFFSRAVEENGREVRLKALKGLSLLKIPEGLAVVLKFIYTLPEIDEDTESVLVDTIVSISERGGLSPLLKEELKKKGKALKVIVKALGEMRCLEAVPVLEGLINTVSKHELREVISAIEAIGSPGSADVLLQTLKSPDGHTRKIAARAVAKIAGERAAGPLLEALRREVYRDVLEEITDVLALVPADAVKTGFCALLLNEKEQLREMGARGLGIIGDEEALRFLKTATKDLSPSVRKAAYNSIARLGIPEAADVVVNGLQDESDDVKLSVLKALGGWTGENIKEAVITALKDKNIWVRYHAVMLLGEMQDPGAEGHVTELLIKDEAPVKAAAARALEKIGSPGSVRVLEQFLDHPDPTVRTAVENAIGTIRC